MTSCAGVLFSFCTLFLTFYFLYIYDSIVGARNVFIALNTSRSYFNFEHSRDARLSCSAAIATSREGSITRIQQCNLTNQISKRRSRMRSIGDHMYTPLTYQNRQSTTHHHACPCQKLEAGLDFTVNHVVRICVVKNQNPEALASKPELSHYSLATLLTLAVRTQKLITVTIAMGKNFLFFKKKEEDRRRLVCRTYFFQP